MMEHMDMSSAPAAHTMMHIGSLKRRFWVSLILAVPVMLLSPMMGMSVSWQPDFPGSAWIVLTLASILFFYGGWPFLKGAASELRHRRPAMMTLIAMGISVSYGYSLYAFVANTLLKTAEQRTSFFWELSTLIVIMLLGHWIEMRAVGSAGNALRKMAELLPDKARLVLPDGSVQEIAQKKIKNGDHVMVRPGDKIPADGTVLTGETTVNESMVTGEARGVVKRPGDTVIGGSVNGNGTVTLNVTGTGESGYLAQVMKLVSQAQAEKSKVESLSDKVARLLFYVALFSGILAFIVWYAVTGQINPALSRMITVFVIACPHALGLAVPLIVARSVSLGARHGLLVRNRNALEKVRHADIVAMDKTGTLTEGRFSVTAIGSFSPQWTEDDILKIAAALEVASNHPLAVGIIEAARQKQFTFLQAEEVSLLNGIGLTGRVGAHEVKIVRVNYLEQQAVSYDRALIKQQTDKGYSVSFLLIDGRAAGFIAQGDRVRPEAHATVDELKKHAIQPVMLTGDNQSAALTVAGRLGITDVHAEVLPEQKEQIIEAYRRQNHVVMMVGDGVNDAPALAKADIGVAIGAGTDVAIDSAEIVLVHSDPYDIIHLLTLARRTSRKMIENLWWAAGYNIVAIPLAAGALAPVGIILSPAVGAILMSLSTVIVAINAMTLNIKP